MMLELIFDVCHFPAEHKHWDTLVRGAESFHCLHCFQCISKRSDSTKVLGMRARN